VTVAGEGSAAMAQPWFLRDSVARSLSSCVSWTDTLGDVHINSYSSNYEYIITPAPSCVKEMIQHRPALFCSHKPRDCGSSAAQSGLKRRSRPCEPAIFGIAGDDSCGCTYVRGRQVTGAGLGPPNSCSTRWHCVECGGTWTDYPQGILPRGAVFAVCSTGYGALASPGVELSEHGGDEEGFGGEVAPAAVLGAVQAQGIRKETAACGSPQIPRLPATSRTATCRGGVWGVVVRRCAAA